MEKKVYLETPKFTGRNVPIEEIAEHTGKCYSHKILTLDGYTKLSLDSYSTCRCIQL